MSAGAQLLPGSPHFNERSTVMTLKKTSWTRTSLFATSILLAAACGKEGSAEEAGKKAGAKIDKAAVEAGEAADKVGDKAAEVADKVEDKAEEAADKLEAAGEKAEAVAEGAVEGAKEEIE